MPKPTHRPGNLPAEATSFVGRRAELAEVRKKLSAARLVSLVGPGGVGKTRLAIRIATDLARGFQGGAWLVELAELRDPSLVGNAVMAALDLRDQTATEPAALLRSYLRDKELLLVLDNCEHLLEAAAQFAGDLMAAAAGVRVIATSREPLSVAGEHVLPVVPLRLPSPDPAEPLAHLRQNEAVMLFIERAGAASGSFDLTASNQEAVVEVCRRLDGLPLAIELAAVRTRALSPEQIRDRLNDRFGLLTGGSRPRSRATRRCAPPSSGATTSSRRSSGPCSPGCASSQAASPWTTSRPCAAATTCRRPRCWTACRRCSTSPWSSRRTSPAPRGTGCTRRCGSTRVSSCARTGPRPPSKGAAPATTSRDADASPLRDGID